MLQATARSISVRVQKRGRILTSRPIILDVYSFLTANTPTILDVLDLFYGRKNVRLGVNGNLGYGSQMIVENIS